MASLAELQEARDAVLVAVYEESDGHILTMVTEQEISNKSGVSGDSLMNILMYLSNEGYIELIMGGGGARLTHSGLKHAERLLSQIQSKADTYNRRDAEVAHEESQPTETPKADGDLNGPHVMTEGDPSSIVTDNPRILTISPRASTDSCSDIRDDLLGRRSYIEAFSDFFSTSQLTGPFTVAITGTWGEGKTVFLEWLSTALRGKGYKTVWFNAWKCDTKHTVWASLALAILETNRTWWLPAVLWLKRAKEKITALWLFTVLFVVMAICTVAINGVPRTFIDYALILPGLAFSYLFSKGLWRIFSGPLLDRLRSANSLDLESELGFQYQFEQEFNRILETLPHGGKPFVIFVDDLDRLSPSKIADVFEAIHFLGNNKNCIFVVGIDLKTVAASLAKRHGEQPTDFGYQFADKFLNLVFSLPEPTAEQVKNYVTWLIAGGGQGFAADIVATQAGKDAIRAVASHIDEDNPIEETFETSAEISSIVIQAMNWIPHNPRKIKRFIDNFRLSAFVAYRLGLLESNQINLLSLAALLIARQNYPGLFELLSERGADQILIALSELFSGSVSEKYRILVERYELSKFQPKSEQLRELIPVLYGVNTKYKQLLDIVH